MSTHATALGISLIAYIFARKFANDRRFTFGTWKIEILGAYTSSIILGIVGLFVLGISIERFFTDVEINYNGVIENQYDKITVESIKNWSKDLQNKYSIVAELFFGQYVNKVISLENNKVVSKKFEMFNILSIPIYGKTLYDSMSKYFEKETDNICCFYCSGDILLRKQRAGNSGTRRARRHVCSPDVPYFFRFFLMYSHILAKTSGIGEKNRLALYSVFCRIFHFEHFLK
jgi:hypothetical protein